MVMWMVYAAAVAGLLAGGGLALERLCARAGWPRRFVWLGALTLAVVIPLTGSPTEQAAGSPKKSPPGLPTDFGADPGIATIGGTTPQTSLLRTAGIRGGHVAGSGRFASTALLFVWALASLSALTVLAGVLVLATRARRRWERHKVGGEDIYVSRRFGPALVGIARPAIVIPRWVLRLGEAVGDRVVKHEREHARAGDHLVLLHAGLILVAFPWSPAVWWMCLRLRAAVEIDCDRRVIASGIPAGEYGRLLLGIGAGRQGGGLFALGMANSGSLLERRLRTIGGERRSMGAPLAVLLGVLAVGSVTVACDLPAPTGIAPAVEGVLAARQEKPSVGREQQGVAAVRQAFDEENGRVVIRGRNRSPLLRLTPASVARDPLVLLDDRIIKGGLNSLMTMVDTLEFRSVGFDGSPNGVAKYGERAAGGTVLIRTSGSAWTTGSAWQSLGRDWRRLTAAWRESESDWEQAGREWEDAGRDLQAAEEDGRVHIRDRTGTGTLSLSAELAARNPRVQLDGEMLRGGLRALLTMMDALDVETFGYYGIPPRVVINTVKQEGGR